MADSAASTQSRTPRANSTKRRANAVSTETEHKLARAARSAQRLAQLSDVPRDDSTLDLFPDDPTRATLEAMNIDIRQGTLHGFELPDVVLAAVGAGTGADGGAVAASETRAARRTREKSEAAESVTLAGFERVEPKAFPAAPVDTVVTAVTPEEGVSGSNTATQGLAEVSGASVDDESKASTSAPGLTPMTPAMAAATVARSVTALRHAQASESATASTATVKAGGVLPQRFATTFARAATASRDQGASAAASDMTDGTLAHGSSGAPADAFAEPADTDASTTLQEPSSPGTSAAPPSPAAPSKSAAAMPSATRLTPELDRARATAFADTVDALYGVISDQRRAATDHSRRMKWMLSIVVGALLATVAIGVTQTVLLMRLTHETTAQQHRIEEMMQNQQAAMTSLLDAHLANANLAATVAPPSAPAVATPVAPHQAPAGAAVAASSASVGKRAAKAHVHSHKAKSSATTSAR